MKKLRLVFFVFCLTLMPVAWAATLPLLFHAGRIDGLQRTPDARKFVLKDEALKQNRLVPKDDDSDLLEDRIPEKIRFSSF